MDYRILLQEENDAVRERYELSMERIRSMDTEEMGLPYGCYFKKVSAFIRRIERLAKRVEETGLSGEDGLEGTSLTLEALQEENYALYQDILPENYRESFANPDYAVKVFGDGYGQLLSFLYTEIRADIVYAFEMRLMNGRSSQIGQPVEKPSHHHISGQPAGVIRPPALCPYD